MKGLLVSHDPNHVADGKLSEAVISHKLLKLAAEVQVVVVGPFEPESCEIMKKSNPLPMHFLRSMMIHDAIKNGWDAEAEPGRVEITSAIFENL